MARQTDNTVNELAELTAGLLDAVYSYSRWEGWLEKCAHFMACDSVALVRWHPDDAPEDIEQFCFGDFAKTPPEWFAWFNELMSFYLPEGPILLDDIIASLEGARDYDVDGLMQRSPPLSGPVKIGLVWWKESYAFLILKRDEKVPWTQLDAKSVRFLLDAIHKSMKLSAHIYEQRLGNAMAAAMLNSSPRGMAIVDSDSRVGFSTIRARAILDKRDGISVEQGYLKIHDPGLQKDLQEAIQKLTAEGTGTFNLSIPRASGKMPYQFMLLAMKTLSISTEYLDDQTFLSFYLHDPTSTYKLSLEQLQRYFSFTQAEAKVARSLFKNDNLADTAEEVGISINTARTHLRRIYRKANVNSQAELMRALSGGLRSELVQSEDIRPDLSAFTTTMASAWDKK